MDIASPPAPSRRFPPAPAFGPFKRAVAAGLGLTLALAPIPSFAQTRTQTLSILRDAEIESLLADYARPLTNAAGVRPVKFVLVNDRTFNAFVADARNIFVNAGAVMEARTPNEIIGVIAHEVGHIQGGHIARLQQEVDNARLLSVAGMLIGAAGVAGAARGGSNIGNAGQGAAGVLSGSQELVRRTLLAYQRSEEQAADRAALTLLAKTGQSPRGMIDTFKRFAEQGVFISSRVDPYILSHPLPAERVANLDAAGRQSPHFDRRDPPALQTRHDLARAKFVGFLESSETVYRRYPPHDGSLAARYARAISTYRQGRGLDAVRQIDALIQAQPKNPWFHELKGQVLLESGRGPEAVAALRRAVALAPGEGLLRLMLGQALAATGDPKLAREAVRELSNAMQREPEAIEGYRHLASAYGRIGDIGMAELSGAQYYFAQQRWRDARTLAVRAKAKLPEGSPGWLKADDIDNHRPKRGTDRGEKD